jgi:hypothetical protein
VQLRFSQDRFPRKGTLVKKALIRFIPAAAGGSGALIKISVVVPGGAGGEGIAAA